MSRHQKGEQPLIIIKIIFVIFHPFALKPAVDRFAPNLHLDTDVGVTDIINCNNWWLVEGCGCCRRLKFAISHWHYYQLLLTPGRADATMQLTMKQEVMDGSGNSLAICKSFASCFRLTTISASHYSFFTHGPDALPYIQPSVSKHWKQSKHWRRNIQNRRTATRLCGMVLLLDITAVCILENFANQQSLIMADRVLKDLGRARAKERYQVCNL